MGVLDGGLEGGEVDLVQGALADGDVDTVALELFVVDDEVLDGGDDAFGLDALDIADGHLAGEERVFAVTFEVAAPEGGYAGC